MYGEVVCIERRGWKRVYDLAERAVPDALLHDDLDDAECLRRLVRLAGQSLGVGTRADIADYHRLKGEQFDAVIADSGLVPVSRRGLGQARLGRPRGAGDRPARPPPHDAAVALRLPDLGAGAHGADLRLHPPPGGVCPQAQAGVRLLRDAAAVGRPAARPGRPGPRGHHAGGQAGLAGHAEGGAGRWPRRCWRRRELGGLRRSVRVERVTARSWRAPLARPSPEPSALSPAGRAVLPVTGSRGSSPASRRPPPPSWSAAAASPGCCGRGSSRCSRR